MTAFAKKFANGGIAPAADRKSMRAYQDVVPYFSPPSKRKAAKSEMAVVKKKMGKKKADMKVTSKKKKKVVEASCKKVVATTVKKVDVNKQVELKPAKMTRQSLVIWKQVAKNSCPKKLLLKIGTSGTLEAQDVFQRQPKFDIDPLSSDHDVPMTGWRPNLVCAKPAIIKTNDWSVPPPPVTMDEINLPILCSMDGVQYVMACDCTEEIFGSLLTTNKSLVTDVLGF